MSVLAYPCNPIGDTAVGPTSGTLTATHGIAVLCALSTRVLESITVDPQPSCVAMSSAASRLYVADHVGDVTVLRVATPALQAVAG